jgi:hypothetical protein
VGTRRVQRVHVGMNVPDDDDHADIISVWRAIPEGSGAQVLEDAFRLYVKTMKEQGHAEGFVVRQRIEQEVLARLDSVAETQMVSVNMLSSVVERLEEFFEALKGGTIHVSGSGNGAHRPAVPEVKRAQPPAYADDSEAVEIPDAAQFLEEDLIDYSLVSHGEYSASQDEIDRRKSNLGKNGW